MRKTIFAAASLAALMMAVIPVVKADTIHADQIRASKMIGTAVYDLNNDKIGTVQDSILDRDGKVALAVVDVGSFLGMGGKDVAVNMSDFMGGNGRLELDRTKQQLKDAPAYELENKVTGAGTTAAPAPGGEISR